jgi:iron complex transport system substrate-binding protein
MRRLAALLLALLAVAAQAAPAARVVSLNLCTDQLVLELLPRERIAMLSTIAADPMVSRHAAEAEGIPRYDGRVESLLQAAPDLVLAGTLAAREGSAVLARLGYRVEMLEMPETIDGSLAMISQVGRLLGEESAARALRAQVEARLARVRAGAGGRPAPLALVYLPNGISPGAGTLRNELLAISGWRNLAALRGIEGHGTITLEEVVLARPELVLFDSVDLAHASLARQTLTHPALAGRVNARAVPSALWMCGGAQVAEAAEFLYALHVAPDAKPAWSE